MNPLRSAMNSLVLVLASTVGVLLLSVTLLSQSTQGSIHGAITGQRGEAIAGATVTFSGANNPDRQLTTDNAGEFSVPNLNSGTYTIRVEAKEFKTLEHRNFVVENGQTYRIELVMESLK
jgi:hypothetical protein